MRKDLSEPERRKSLAEEFILDIKHIKMQLRESENIIRINNFLILIEEKFNNYIKECDADHENKGVRKDE